MSEVQELAAVLENRSEMYYRRRDALVKLMKLDPQRGTEALLSFASDPEKVLRREIARLLGQCPAGKAMPALRTLLGDEDSDVRKNALQSIAAVGSEADAAAVRPLLDDQSFFVKREAEKTLEKLSKPAAGKMERAAARPQAAPPAAASPAEPPAAHEASRESALASREPPWKTAGPLKAVAEASPAGEEKPADYIQRLREKRDRLKAEKSRKTVLRQSPALAPAKAQSPDVSKRPYKVYIPVAVPGGGTAPPAAPTPLREPPPVPTREESAAAAKICPKCRWVLKAGQRYCNFCGFALTTSGGPAAAPPPRPLFTPKYTGRPVTSFTRSSSTGKSLGCAGAAIAMFAGVIAVVIGISMKSSSRARKDEVIAARVKRIEQIEKQASEARARREMATEKAAVNEASKSEEDGLGAPLMADEPKANYVFPENAQVSIRMVWNELFVGRISDQNAESIWIDVGEGKVFKLSRSQIAGVTRLK